MSADPPPQPQPPTHNPPTSIHTPIPQVVPAIQGFVSATLGAKFTEPPPFDLAGSYKESSCTSPLLFVLSTGSDPTAALLQFADTMGYGSKISVISMGQGQGPKAAALIAAARKAGSWVLLQVRGEEGGGGEEEGG